MPKDNTSIQKKQTKKKSKSGDSIETMQDAFIHELSDMRDAEEQLTKALPKMAKAASDPQLAEAFETHKQETEHQIELIQQAVKAAGVKLKRAKCDAMKGLVEEGKKIIKNVSNESVRDAMLIAAAQKVEHYEIASYGSLVAAAKQLGFTEAAEILDQILDQEKQTDEKLNQLAMQGINEEASQQDQTQKGSTMSRYDRERESSSRRGRMPERDEEGRFMSDDDRNYGRGRSYSDDRSRYDQDYDDRRYSRSSRDDDYGRDYDDDRSSRSGGRGQGGWFGDSEGHSRAAREGARSRSDYRSSSRDDRYYDDDRSSRSRGSSSGRGRGWFGDPEGHARAGSHSHDYDRNSGRR